MAAARVAMENGRRVEAQDRLEEACRLDPDGLEARLLLEELHPPEADDPGTLVAREESAPAHGAGQWSHWVAVGIAVIVLAALALLRQPAPEEFRPTPARGPSMPGSPRGEAPAVARAGPAAASTPPGKPAEAHVQPRDESEERAVGTGGQNVGATPAMTPGERTSRAGLPAPTGRPPVFVPASESVLASGARSPGAREEPAPVRPAVSEAVPPAPLGNTLASQSLARQDLLVSSSLPPGASAPAPPPGAPATSGAGQPVSPAVSEASGTDPAPASLRAPDPEEEIEQTLQRYAEAYERLDARAARRVWPTVDERALARAFAGLESQGITFDRCETQLAGNEATAVCRGRARFVPKVGSQEPLSETREWTFRLSRSESGWQIVSARAR